MILLFLLIVIYIVIAGATHGYAKYRWPPKLVRSNEYYEPTDENSIDRILATIFWPIYWSLIWPFTKTNEVTFSHIEKHAAKQIAKNKSRVADLHASRTQLEASNSELEQAELELEKEIAKTF